MPSLLLFSTNGILTVSSACAFSSKVSERITSNLLDPFTAISNLAERFLALTTPKVQDPLALIVAQLDSPCLLGYIAGLYQGGEQYMPGYKH